MSYETILYDAADGIATITLNRPDKMNAYTATMGREIVEAFQRADEDRQVRTIILTGAGRAFCAGADIAGFANAIEAQKAPPSVERGYRASGARCLRFRISCAR